MYSQVIVLPLKSAVVSIPLFLSRQHRIKLPDRTVYLRQTAYNKKNRNLLCGFFVKRLVFKFN